MQEQSAWQPSVSHIKASRLSSRPLWPRGQAEVSERILLSQESLMCQGPERQQEIITAHAPSEQTVLKSRMEPCVRKSNQGFFLGQ